MERWGLISRGILINSAGVTYTGCSSEAQGAGVKLRVQE